LPERDNRRNSERFNILSALVNEYFNRVHNVCDRSIPGGLSGSRFDRSSVSHLCGQAFSSSCPPSLDDISARLGGHPFQKAMSSFAFDSAGLIRSFHNNILLNI